MMVYRGVFEETLEYYFGSEHYPKQKTLGSFELSEKEAIALDEYLACLINGCINVQIRPNLEKYLMELIKDEWFHQWPMIRWAYATRLLHKEKASAKSLKHAVELLLQLADEGFPGAMCDMAECYCHGIVVDRSYERAICLWVAASRQGYKEAHTQVKLEYDTPRSKELTDELRLFLVNRRLWILIEEKNLRDENGVICPEKLTEGYQRMFYKLFEEHSKLLDLVSKKICFRYAEKLSLSDDDNPYSIGRSIRKVRKGGVA
jgi:TPR repeat protein